MSFNVQHRCPMVGIFPFHFTFTISFVPFHLLAVVIYPFKNKLQLQPARRAGRSELTFIGFDTQLCRERKTDYQGFTFFLPVNKRKRRLISRQSRPFFTAASFFFLCPKKKRSKKESGNRTILLLLRLLSNMKIAAYILSFIVLLLSVTPCVDNNNTNCGQQTEIDHSTSGSHQNDLDHCSPFCTCQCCQTSFNIPISISSSTPIAIDVVHPALAPVFQSIDLFDYFIPPKA